MARFSNPFIQYLDGNPDTLPGSKLDFFEPGTTTPKDTFSDSALTTANPNPVVADADGRMPAIYLAGTYKVVLKDSADVTLDTADPIGLTTTGQFELWDSGVTYDIPDVVVGSDDDYYRSLSDGNVGNDPTSSPSNWEQLELGRIYNANITYGLGDQVIGSDGMTYFGLVAANLNNNPTLDATSTNWRAADQIRSADATGTVDVITATYIPAVLAFKDGLILRVRASGANATTTPTLAANGIAAKTIVKDGNLPLGIGDINGADHELLLVANTANDNYELLNPSNADRSLSNLTATGRDKVAEAFINFDGTGTVATNDSFNISSLVDNGTGDYTVNIDTNFPNVNFLVTLGSQRTVGNIGIVGYESKAVGSVDIITADSSGTPTNHEDISAWFTGGQ